MTSLVEADAAKAPEISEIRALANAEGLVTCEAVVERARDPRSPLHSHFTWDDTEAAAKFRLVEAAVLIRRLKVHVTPVQGQAPLQVRAFVSLGTDRVEGGGYRMLQSVLSDADMKKAMLRTARAELNSFLRKYRSIEELSSVVSAIEKLPADE